MTGAASASAGARAATSWPKRPPWRCPRPAPAPPQGAADRSGTVVRGSGHAFLCLSVCPSVCLLARRSQGRGRPTGRRATASDTAASQFAGFPTFYHVGGDIMHADGTVLHTVGAGAATARAAEAAPSAPSGSST